MGRRLDRSERGLATVELVVVFPLLFLCIMLVVQFGLWAHASHVFTAVGPGGARSASAEDGSAAAGQDRARALIAAGAPPATPGAAKGLAIGERDGRARPVSGGGRVLRAG